MATFVRRPLGAWIAALVAGTLVTTGAAGQSGSPAPSAPSAAPTDACAPFGQDAAPAEADPDDPYRCRLPAWDPTAVWPFAGTPSWYVDGSEGLTAGDAGCIPDDIATELTGPR